MERMTALLYMAPSFPGSRSPRVHHIIHPIVWREYPWLPMGEDERYSEGVYVTSIAPHMLGTPRNDYTHMFRIRRMR